MCTHSSSTIIIFIIILSIITTIISITIFTIVITTIRIDTSIHSPSIHPFIQMLSFCTYFSFTYHPFIMHHPSFIY